MTSPVRTFPKALLEIRKLQSTMEAGTSLFVQRQLLQYPQLTEMQRQNMKNGLMEWTMWSQTKKDQNTIAPSPFEPDFGKVQQDEDYVKSRLKESLVEIKPEQVTAEEDETDLIPAEPTTSKPPSRKETIATPAEHNTLMACYWEQPAAKRIHSTIRTQSLMDKTTKFEKLESEPTLQPTDIIPRPESSKIDQSPMAMSMSHTKLSTTNVSFTLVFTQPLQKQPAMTSTKDTKHIPNERRKVKTVSMAREDKDTEPDIPKLTIFPAEVNFGYLQVGQVYTTSVSLSNFGSLPGRFTVKHYNTVSNKEFRVNYRKGPVCFIVTISTFFADCTWCHNQN